MLSLNSWRSFSPSFLLVLVLLEALRLKVHLRCFWEEQVGASLGEGGFGDPPVHLLGLCASQESLIQVKLSLLLAAGLDWMAFNGPFQPKQLCEPGTGFPPSAVIGKAANVFPFCMGGNLETFLVRHESVTQKCPQTAQGCPGTSPGGWCGVLGPSQPLRKQTGAKQSGLRSCSFGNQPFWWETLKIFCSLLGTDFLKYWLLWSDKFL